MINKKKPLVSGLFLARKQGVAFSDAKVILFYHLCNSLTRKRVKKFWESGPIFHETPDTERAKLSMAKVLRHIEDEGLQIIGAPRFSYIDGAWNKEDEAEWRTEIQVPVK